jgi:hypothetical protein
MHFVPFFDTNSTIMSLWWLNWPVDEPHGSLFMYFRIFTPLADDHVFASHITGVTWPIPTFGNQFRSFPLICDNFWSFLPSANVSRALRTLSGYHATLWKFYDSVKQLLRTPACRYIKIARLHQLTALAQLWPGDSEISRRSCDSRTGVISRIW